MTPLPRAPSCWERERACQTSCPMLSINIPCLPSPGHSVLGAGGAWRRGQHLQEKGREQRGGAGLTHASVHHRHPGPAFSATPLWVLFTQRSPEDQSVVPGEGPQRPQPSPQTLCPQEVQASLASTPGSCQGLDRQGPKPPGPAAHTQALLRKERAKWEAHTGANTQRPQAAPPVSPTASTTSTSGQAGPQAHTGPAPCPLAKPAFSPSPSHVVTLGQVGTQGGSLAA